MPTSIRRLNSDKYQVRTPNKIKAKGTTLAKALAQQRLLRGLKSGRKK